jgi:hypothetical protein
MYINFMLHWRNDPSCNLEWKISVDSEELQNIQGKCPNYKTSRYETSSQPLNVPNTTLPHYKMSQLQNIPSLETSQLQNVPNTKCPKPHYVPTTKRPKKMSQTSLWMSQATKCPKLQNIPSYMTEWMPNVLDYQTIFVSYSSAVQ